MVIVPFEDNFDFTSANIPVQIADVLAKNQCINVEQKFQEVNRWITWVELMERDMRGTQLMKKENDPRWKSQKDYTELINVFKKYTQDTNNTTQRINDGQ